MPGSEEWVSIAEPDSVAADGPAVGEEATAPGWLPGDTVDDTPAGAENSSNASPGPPPNPTGSDCAQEGGAGFPTPSSPWGPAPLGSNQEVTVCRSVGPPAKSNRPRLEPGPEPAPPFGAGGAPAGRTGSARTEPAEDAASGPGAG